MPIAIGISLVAGLIAVVDALVVYLRGQGIEATTKGRNTRQLIRASGSDSTEIAINEKRPTTNKAQTTMRKAPIFFLYGN